MQEIYTKGSLKIVLGISCSAEVFKIFLIYILTNTCNCVILICDL